MPNAPAASGWPSGIWRHCCDSVVPRGADNRAMLPPARSVALLLNVAHALDHLFLLIFATAVAAIAS